MLRGIDYFLIFMANYTKALFTFVLIYSYDIFDPNYKYILGAALEMMTHLLLTTI